MSWIQAYGRAWSWRLLSRRMHQKGYIPNFRHRHTQKVLIVCENNRIPDAQVYPFYHYANRFLTQHRMEVAFVSRATVESQLSSRCTGADWVLFQTWYDHSADFMEALIVRLRRWAPAARLAYLDWFAPTDLRYAEVLHPHIELYYKKNLLKDRSRYGQPTLGHTNLTDYYARKFQLDEAPACFAIPNDFMAKVRLAPCFALGPAFLPGFLKESGRMPLLPTRTIDLHARLGVTGSPWYAAMRQEAVAALDTLEGIRIARQGKVSRRQFMKELHNSRICFSPFGFGEVCWRDYEAVLTGAALLKPNMQHIETIPNIFIPFQTFISCRWDYQDFKSLLEHYLQAEDERLQITQRAFGTVQAYIRNADFVTATAADLGEQRSNQQSATSNERIH